MAFTQYNKKATLFHYLLAGGLYGAYGGKVCPFLDTLSLQYILSHVGIVFFVLTSVRFMITQRWLTIKGADLLKLDVLLFGSMGVVLAIWFNSYHDFPIDSNAKVVFGMVTLGILTGSNLSLMHRYEEFVCRIKNNQLAALQQGAKESIAKKLVMLIILLLLTLTTVLTMVAVKDLYWLQNHVDKLLDGSARVSVIKEFVYVTAVMVGYTIMIMASWVKLLDLTLLKQQEVLQKVADGNMDVRVPVFSNDELGQIAGLTNNMLNELQQTHQEVMDTRDVAIIGLSALAESRDNETGAHILRTQEYVKALAQELAMKPGYQSLLTPSYIELLYKSAPLHDVGKVGIPDAILLKPGKLTDEEFEIMKKHPEIGAEALSIAEQQMGSSSFLSVAREIAHTHHEKWDGTGYPQGLAGDTIPLSGRLMALADVYDALISKRVYKPAFSHDKAKAIILEGEGTHFDPEVIKAFLNVENEFVQIAGRIQDKEGEVPEKT